MQSTDFLAAIALLSPQNASIISDSPYTYLYSARNNVSIIGACLIPAGITEIKENETRDVAYKLAALVDIYENGSQYSYM